MLLIFLLSCCNRKCGGCFKIQNLSGNQAWVHCYVIYWRVQLPQLCAEISLLLEALCVCFSIMHLIVSCKESCLDFHLLILILSYTRTVRQCLTFRSQVWSTTGMSKLLDFPFHWKENPILEMKWCFRAIKTHCPCFFIASLLLILIIFSKGHSVLKENNLWFEEDISSLVTASITSCTSLCIENIPYGSTKLEGLLPTMF